MRLQAGYSLEKCSLEKYSIDEYSLEKYSLEKYSLDKYIMCERACVRCLAECSPICLSDG